VPLWYSVLTGTGKPLSSDIIFRPTRYSRAGGGIMLDEVIQHGDAEVERIQRLRGYL